MQSLIKVKFWWLLPVIRHCQSWIAYKIVLGPPLFLVFINDLPKCASSSIHFFADDALLYVIELSNLKMTLLFLKKDLLSLQEWEKKLLMSFNADKCKVLRITNKRNVILGTTPYSIYGTSLRTDEEAKYLGVTIHRNLSWKPHINNICKKSNSTLGFLRRNLRKCPAKIKEKTYQAYVRPTLEYSLSVWNQHTQDLISQIDMVQWRAARFLMSD